ncbi:MAG TPA: class I tRNA ligase family protein, partial [Thermoplasmata archaeon]
DPVPLIEKYGGDSIRYYAATCALGIDHAFKEQELVRGGRLATKTWNVMKMIGSACKRRPEKPDKMHPIDAWILSRFGATVREYERYADKYRFDQAMSQVENFLWHEFADHYIELAKHRGYADADEGARYALYTVGLGVLKMISVFLPHVTEDAYQLWFKQHEEPISIHVSGWPEASAQDELSERSGEAVKEIVASVRSWKSSEGLSLNEEIARVEIIGARARELAGGSEDDIKATLKAKDVGIAESAALSEIVVGAKPNLAKIGPAFKKDAKLVADRIRSASVQDLSKGISAILSDGRTTPIGSEYFELEKRVVTDKGEVEQLSAAGLSILIYK